MDALAKLLSSPPVPNLPPPSAPTPQAAAGAPKYAGAEDTRGVLRAGGNGGEATAAAAAASEDASAGAAMGTDAGTGAGDARGSLKHDARHSAPRWIDCSRAAITIQRAAQIRSATFIGISSICVL